MECTGKVMAAFGDSIVAGHLYQQRSCADVVADAEGMRLIKLARNGATILPSELKRADLGGQIVRQCDEMPSDTPTPDVVLFNGGTNDAFARVLSRLGTVRPWGDDRGGAGSDEAAYDPDTFAGCFELTIREFRRRWPNARLVYLAVAKLSARQWPIQLALRAIELDACAKWGVRVADVFGSTDLDPRRAADRVAYSFNELGSDGLPGTPQTITYPHPESQPSGTHPNFPAIERFYAPVIRRALREL